MRLKGVVYCSVSCMAVSIEELNDGITFDQNTLAKSTNQKPCKHDVSVSTKLACDTSTLEQLER